MTNEEAIEFGNMWLEINEDCKDSSTYTFFQMAIKALEAQLAEDAISRQATIDAIYKKYIGGKDAIENAPINDLYADGLEEAVDAVWDMPPVTPWPKIGRWIPCTERLPEQSGWYLVSTKNRNVQKAWYRVAPINQGGSYWKGSIKRPIAWMPLPELYKAEE